MKRLSSALAVAILLAVGALAVTPAPSSAQVYTYPGPPANIYATPWVGANTPWVYYKGDWFLNGVLYYFFGPKHGWAPYYSYPTTYIVRPKAWYAPKWNAWYKNNPVYWNNFTRSYPYWQGHNYWRRYDQRFYNQYHHGQGAGWHKGYHGQPYHPKPIKGPPPGPRYDRPRPNGGHGHGPDRDHGGPRH
jgi:hypothetical protein